MKITNFGPDGIPVPLAGWSTGVTSINSNATTTDGGLSALNFVQRITANGSNILLNPSVNFAAGSNIILAAASNTITINSTGGGSGSISAGSNSSDVSGLSSAGASTTLWSPFDHLHAGIATVTASSSNTLERPVLNLRPGSGIALNLTDTDGDGTFDTVTVVNTGVVQTGPAGPAGAAGTYRLPLDSYALNGTYGDDFTGASLSGIWTRRNFTSGAETYQYGPAATHMNIAMTSRAAGDGYFQTAPAGDWTFMMSVDTHFWPSNRMIWSLCVVNSVGTGLGTSMHESPDCFLVGGITTYSTYSGSFQQTPSWSIGVAKGERKTWVYLRKSGTNYFGAFSFDGETWSAETPAFSSAITVDRVGMIVHPLGGITTTAFVAVDLFNKIA